jgi:hypothetical protein
LSGNATAASGYTSGVYGYAASTNGTGVYGSSTNWVGVGGETPSTIGNGVAGFADATTGYTNGVYGVSASPLGSGVNGNATAATGGASGVFGSSIGPDAGIGVWGSYQGTSGNGVGVRGDIEAPSTGTAGLFLNASGQGLILSGVSGPNFNQVLSVDSSGNLDISGNLTVAGSKSARVKLEDGREVALYAVESPENWFEDFGTAQLQAGTAAVSLDPGFLETVNTAADYHVFLTPRGDCRGLYVARTTSGGFEVRELGGGSASIAFDYRIVAHRRGFETVRLKEVHLPPAPKELQFRPASTRSVERAAPPQPPRVAIPVLPQQVELAH